MRVVTLTTDFGYADYYTAMLKGALLKANPLLNIVDITHQIKHFDIVRAAFVLKNSWSSFPEESIHITTVNDLQNGSTQFLVTQYKNHYFIGPNNGIFSLLFEEMPETIYELPKTENSSFPLLEILANGIAYIDSGKPLSKIGKKITAPMTRLNLHPVISPNQIRGTVIYIDHFENVIINIHKDLFDQVRNNRNFKLYFKRNNPITELSDFYFDVPIGAALCRINPSNYLEISVNMGKAASLFNLKIDDTVQIDFE